MERKSKALAFTQIAELDRICPNAFIIRGNADKSVFRPAIAVLAAVVAVLALTLCSASAWAQVTISVGDIMVVDPNAFSGQSRIIRVDPTNPTFSTNQTLISQGGFLQESAGLVIEADGNILVTDRVLPGVVRVNPSTGAQSIVHSGAPFIDPFGIALEADGNIVITDTGCTTHNCATGGHGGATIYRIHPITGVVTAVSPSLTSGPTNYLDNPYGIEVEDAGTLVVTDATSAVSPLTGQGGIIRINPTSGIQSIVYQGNLTIGCLFGITVEPVTGGILNTTLDPGAFPGSGYGCTPGAINRANPVTGSNAAVSSHSVGWQAPFGMDVDVDQTILVVDEFYAGVFRVNPSSGTPTLLTQFNLLVQPTDLAVATPENTPPPLSGADLSVTKTDGVTTVTAGDGVTYTYTITVHNGGPVSATAVNLADTWPTGFTQGTITPSQGTCSSSGGNFTCSLGNLANGANATVTVTYTVPSTTAAGSQTNTVTVSSSTSDPSMSNNTASDTNTVGTSANLSVTKDDGVTTVTAGDGITRTYTIAVNNAGPSQATSVSLSDTWPTGFTQGTITPSQGTCSSSGGNFTCSLGNLANGANATVTVTYTVPSTTTGSQTNTVTVSSSTSDPSSGNNTASDTNTVGTSANLSVTKSDGVTTVTAGDGITRTYTIAVNNAGPSQATSVSLSDTWPTGFTQGTITPSQGTCSSSGGNFTCSLGSIASGSSATVTVNYTVPLTTPAGSQTNTVTVTSSTSDPNSSNNTASDTNTVNSPPPPSADLSLTKTDSADPVDTGSSFSYTLTVSNSGPDTATNLTVTDTLPTGVNFVSATGSGWTCNTSGQTVTCTNTSLNSGSSSSITINVTAPSQAGTINNTASVTSSTNDPNTSNNSDSESTTVNVAPNAKWTGSGQINVSGGKATFGFNIQRKNGTISGQVDFDNHVTDYTFDSLSINTLNVTGNRAVFTGTGRKRIGNGSWSGPFNFTVTVYDFGDPGTNDRFKIEISDGTTEGSDVSPIRSGNIKQQN